VGVDEYILGKTNGYIRLDLKKEKLNTHRVYLDKVSVLGQEPSLAELDTELILPFENRSLEFSFHVPFYGKYQEIEFSYQLQGAQDFWSPWGKSSKAKFENLPWGSYQFKVKSRIAGNPSENIATYEFVIKRPFYLSNLAIIAYLLTLIVLGIGVHRAYKGHFQRKSQEAKLRNQRELENIRIKNEQKITELKNRELEIEIESKNRELAILTMNNIKRNDFLTKVKKELKSQTDLPGNSSIYKLIENNLNNEKDWEFFEEAFNNTDKDFLGRAKKLCPDLNPNDLKFCTYVRLNLSAKEIASLLNISVKSVEVRRYRLRKKFGLDPKVNLTEFVLSI
jgi:AraC family transcriptional regulator, chitin signaling transcriptional activator